VGEELGIPYHYASADLATLQDLSWLRQQWETARSKAHSVKRALFIVDEVQKIPDWSSLIKSQWDQDSREKTNLSVLILGSSPWLVQKGLSESLAGRFELIHATHWSYDEMKNTFGWTLDRFLYFGGYPGAAPLADERDASRFLQYVNDSLIETTLSRDILLMTQINKPVLLRRLFQFGCQYSGQILSFTKMLGELHEAGNTTTLAHYLDLLAGAGLICGLQKYSAAPIRQRNSSPKLTVFNTALMSAQSSLSFVEAKQNPIFWGRLVESAVGAYLVNAVRGTQIELFYWREANFEVDYVLRLGDELLAIEVKSNSDRLKSIDSFVQQFHPSRILLVGKEGIHLEDFLTSPLIRFFGKTG